MLTKRRLASGDENNVWCVNHALRDAQNISALEALGWQMRTHCCGHIVAHDVSWACKHAGHKMIVVFLCCANWETFVADTKCF